MTEIPNLVIASHPASNRNPDFDSTVVGRFRGKRLNIELGQQVVNSGKNLLELIKKNLPKPSFYFTNRLS
jgi:hypothetical protein